MKNLIVALVVTIALASAAFAATVFTPKKTVTLTHTKAAVRYTPTSGTEIIRINPTAAVYAQLSSAQMKKDVIGFPYAANATAEVGIGKRSTTGVEVKKVIFTGASSAAKTIYIQEQ